MRERIVGIDLGTTNSLVAIMDQTGPRIIPDAQGRALLPSVVRYERAADKTSIKAVVGDDAKSHAAEFPHTTVSSVKRLMGRSRADAAHDLPFLSYDVVEGAHGQCRVSLPLDPSSPTLVTPQEVSSVILRELRDRASRALDVPIAKAVITVPAYFDHAQREATRDAGRLAGLDVVRVVPEPTAAALAYGLGIRASSDPAAKRAARAVAVFDLGGGTFDISILRVIPPTSDTGREIFQVLATAGDTHLGGDDVDHAIVHLVTRDLPRDPSPHAKQAILAAAERAKVALSETLETTIDVPLDSGSSLRRTLTRDELETLMAPWVARAMDCCARVLRDAADQLAGDSIDAVVMVGGSTRIPLVRRRVAELFQIEPYTAIDPDQVVALGAAVQASILAGETSDALLLDVLPLSLGLETANGAVAKIILRNSAVPARATEMFSTQVDGQTSIKLHVLQGEREMVADCRSLGVFHLRGLPPMPAGIPQVEVEFLVDANGVLRVSAHERRSGRRATLQIIPNHGLTREEVARMESESLTHAREDMTRHRIADLIANATLDLKWIGERLTRFRGKLDPAYAAELDAAIATLTGFIDSARRDWSSVDAEAFSKAKDTLDRTSMRLQEIGIAESLRD